MAIKRLFHRGINLVNLIIIVLILFILGSTALYQKYAQVSNEKRIQYVLEQYSRKGKGVSVDFSRIEGLLRLKNLTVQQKARIYLDLTLQYYLDTRIDRFLDVVGYGIFYNIKAGKEENAIYLYSMLSNYYLEIGADNSAYEMILKARKLKNFYRIEDPVTKMQALHIYGRYLVHEDDFEDAIKAQSRIAKVAEELSHERPDIGQEYQRAVQAFTAYITLLQGDTDKAQVLADQMYGNGLGDTSGVTHFEAYDYHIPLMYVKTHCALRKGNFTEAIRFGMEYARICKQFNFTMKKIQLFNEILFALPESMTEERKLLSEQQALDSDILAQTFLDNFTRQTGSELDSVMDGLNFSEDLRQGRSRLFHGVLFSILVFLLLFYILCIVYIQTQIDGLTRLRNRRALDVRIGRFAALGKRYSAIMLDIDNFKRLNDTFGHDFGDYVLQEVAQILLNNESHNVKCYRYGGEEMVAFIERLNFDQTIRLAEKIRSEIADTKWEKDVRVTASLGLGFDKQEPVKEADANMYVAKQKGKNFTAYKKDGKQYLAERRLDIRNEIPTPR